MPAVQGLSMARRTFNSIESTADQAEAFVQQGRWADAERHYRELIGQTHVINYEYDDWLRRLGEIYRQLGRAREAAFVYLYLHYFDMARAQLAGDAARRAARAARRDREEVERGGAALPAGEAAGARGGRVRARQAVPRRRPRAWKGAAPPPRSSRTGPTRPRSSTSTTASRRCGSMPSPPRRAAR